MIKPSFFLKGEHSVIYLIMIFVIILILWFGSYIEGRYYSGCNGPISFRLFEKMYGRFPDKWVLHSEYVCFYYDDPNSYILKEYRAYFSPTDLIQYWLYKYNDEYVTKRSRKKQDFEDVSVAFAKLEERIR